MRAGERERRFSLAHVGELEDHRGLARREATDHLPAPLDARHAHHLPRLDVVVPRDQVVDELFVAGLCVHLRKFGERKKERQGSKARAGVAGLGFGRTDGAGDASAPPAARRERSPIATKKERSGFARARFAAKRPIPPPSESESFHSALALAGA